MNMKSSRALALKFHAIRQVGVDRLDVAGERGIFQAAGHAAVSVFLALSSTTRLASAGTPPLNRATTKQRRATFDLGIAGIDLDVAGAGFGKDRRARFGL